jgi:hypothetical protein
MKGLVLFGVGLMVMTVAGTARADGDFKNLKVLDGADHKALEKGMKTLSKGLAVKCNVCHVKGKFDSDDVAAKGSARTFLEAVVGEKDQAKKDAALKSLLEALKLEKAKDPAKVWQGIGLFKRKAT